MGGAGHYLAGFLPGARGKWPLFGSHLYVPLPCFLPATNWPVYCAEVETVKVPCPCIFPSTKSPTKVELPGGAG